eukprot:scaffold6831_cov71-Isochrysis_galbana.AAC.1
MAWLGLATVAIAYLSEALTGAIEGTTAQLGISDTFVGFVIIPVWLGRAHHGPFSYRWGGRVHGPFSYRWGRRVPGLFSYRWGKAKGAPGGGAIGHLTQHGVGLGAVLAAPVLT